LLRKLQFQEMGAASATGDGDRLGAFEKPDPLRALPRACKYPRGARLLEKLLELPRPNRWSVIAATRDAQRNFLRRSIFWEFMVFM
jgi:hypothetical protein